MPERDRGLEVADRLGGRREQARAFARVRVRVRRLAVVAREFEVAGDDRRIGVAHREPLADPPVHEASPREADAVLGNRPQPLVAEVVGVVALDDQPARGELIEGLRNLLLRAAAREAQRVSVEGAPDQCGRTQHLAGGAADSVQPRLHERPCAAGRARPARKQFGDEQREPFALTEHRLARLLVKAGSQREVDDVLAREAPEHNALAEGREPRVSVLGIGFVGATCAQQHHGFLREAVCEVGERVKRGGIAPLEIVDEDDARGRERVGDRLEEAQACPGLLEAARRRRPQLGEHACEFGAKGRLAAGGAAQQLGEHAICERLLAGVCPRPKHAGAARLDRLKRLLRKARLADARLAFDQHERGALVVCVEQPPELARAAHERKVEDA